MTIAQVSDGSPEIEKMKAAAAAAAATAAEPEAREETVLGAGRELGGSE